MAHAKAQTNEGALLVQLELIGYTKRQVRKKLTCKAQRTEEQDHG
jgi:hypothetical protein